VVARVFYSRLGLGLGLVLGPRTIVTDNLVLALGSGLVLGLEVSRIMVRLGSVCRACLLFRRLLRHLQALQLAWHGKE
jgi:hypothetical protein